VEDNLDFKAKVMGILELSECSDKRGAKMDQDDYLRLLVNFNEAGIHFHSSSNKFVPEE
jgi:hypothetical protein